EDAVTHPKMPTAGGKWTEREDDARWRYMQDERLKNNWALLSCMPEHVDSGVYSCASIRMEQRGRTEARREEQRAVFT
ncbi:MAG: hypothetical protein ACPIOQ_30475, partial [Promethearchaeia archaeon]